jgi:hypothetical protein
VGVRQEDFFDLQAHQYAQALVERPPLHTAREIDAIISRLRRHGGVASVVDFGAGSGRLTIPLLRHTTRSSEPTSSITSISTRTCRPSTTPCARGRVIFSEPGGCNPTWYIYLPLTAPWHIAKACGGARIFNLMRKLAAHGFGEASVSGLGLLPRPFFNWSKALSALNDALGNLPLIKLFAYRYIIEASARPEPAVGDRA